ncbi:MAG: ion channel [Arenimonas sp.]
MPWPSSLRRHPSAFLLLAQLLSLVLFPMMDNTGNGRLLFAAAGTVVVALALWVVNRSPALNWVAWLLAALAICVTLASLAPGHAGLMAYSSLFESALYFYAAGGLIMYMLHDHEVSGDELFAAGATFTLLAWAFAYAFFVCQAWYPGSFTALNAADQPRSWVELLFLSFTSLSGVGIGDILPISAPARVLVMLEEFAGVGYIAAIVSRLIGLTIRDRR